MVIKMEGIIIAVDIIKKLKNGDLAGFIPGTYIIAIVLAFFSKIVKLTCRQVDLCVGQPALKRGYASEFILKMFSRQSYDPFPRNLSTLDYVLPFPVAQLHKN